jgi:hypothetical protein
MRDPIRNGRSAIGGIVPETPSIDNRDSRREAPHLITHTRASGVARASRFERSREGRSR